MVGMLITLERIEDYFGASRVPLRADHERDRALQRGLIVSIMCSIWAVDFVSNVNPWLPGRLTLLCCGIAYALGSFAFRRFLLFKPGGGVLLQYLFLIGDQVFLILALVLDAERLAFLYPFLFLVIIRCGIRFGTRTMWLTWAVTLALAAGFLPLSAYWMRETQLTLSFLLLLALIPVFFLTLIRRIHKVRILEEERARVGAMHEVVTARNAFLSKVSHELRSPLQSIVSALDVFEMRHGHGTAEDDELIGRMRRSSMLLNTQLRDLLTLARGQAGRLEMHPEPFEACTLVEGVALAAREAAKEKGLALKLSLPPAAVFVVADAARIDQVLTNLVANSVRYTHVGEVRVTLHPYDTTTKHLRFEVADTGPGIPPAMLPTLLEPDKLASGNERKGQGSGIGLAVVRTLVDHLGGSVSVTSQEGEGTAFALEIPAELIDAEGSRAAPDSPTGRVLIVDDRNDVLTGLTSVINELGYECDRAESAAIAANLLAVRRYDAVLLDIQMPIKSGAELATETRGGNGPNQQTRLLGMSAAEVAAQYADGPFDACLAKPIDRNALISALRDEWPETWPSGTT